MRFRFILSVFIVVLVALAGSAGPARADDVAALKAKLIALDKTRLGGANEKALLGEIGGLAKGLKARAIPEDFHRRMARGRAFVKSAKNRSDFRSAAKEFRAAVSAAPWVAAGHYNLGIVRDKAGLYDGAIRSLRTYLALKPGASDARKVRNLTYKIEVRKEKAAKARRAAKKKSTKTRKEKRPKPPTLKEKAQKFVGVWSDKYKRFRIKPKGKNFEIHIIAFLPGGDHRRAWKSINKRWGSIRIENGRFMLSFYQDSEIDGVRGGRRCKFGPGYARGPAHLEENGNVLKANPKLTWSNDPACGFQEFIINWKRYR